MPTDAAKYNIRFASK